MDEAEAVVVVVEVEVAAEAAVVAILVVASKQAARIGLHGVPRSPSVVSLSLCFLSQLELQSQTVIATESQS